MRIENYDSDTANKIRKFNQKNLMSPVGSPERPSPYAFESPKEGLSLKRVKKSPKQEPVKNSSTSEEMLI